MFNKKIWAELKSLREDLEFLTRHVSKVASDHALAQDQHEDLRKMSARLTCFTNSFLSRGDKKLDVFEAINKRIDGLEQTNNIFQDERAALFGRVAALEILAAEKSKVKKKK